MAERASEPKRAFELARNGEYDNVSEIVKQLRKEGYDGRQIEGPTLRTQLWEIAAKALAGNQV